MPMLPASTTFDPAALTAALRRFPSIRAAWLFGSARDGRVRPGGDVDIGVWCARRPRWQTLDSMIAAVQQATGVENVDVCVLNDAAAILRFEAVCGRRLLARAGADYPGFASLAAREYESAMALLHDYAPRHRAAPRGPRR
ncbi:MAG: nucleotidyltransferase domain-containing protein [bacterium]|nr:nucleotidyltransferase domain-containing protein [bacterium]